MGKTVVFSYRMAVCNTRFFSVSACFLNPRNKRCQSLPFIEQHELLLDVFPFRNSKVSGKNRCLNMDNITCLFIIHNY